MTSKERVRKAVNFIETDRPPFSATFTPEISEQLRKISGDVPDIGVYFGHDMVKCTVGLETSYDASTEPTYICKWGITWANVVNSSGKYTEMIKHPLAGDYALLDTYQIPDPNEPTQYDHCRKMIELYGDEKWIIGSCQCSIFEASWYLRGMDAFLMDMALDEEYTKKLIDKVSKFAFGAAKNYIELGVDMVWFGDDIATQNNMMISPDMWRRYFKPVYKELFAYCKQLNPEIKIAYHSCGNLEAVIEDFIEIGLDVLNPIQPLAMKPIDIKKKYGDRLVLFGGLDVQLTMPTGTPEQVTNEVKYLKEVMGKGGGFILNPAHHIQADTDIENVLAYYEEAKKNVDRTCSTNYQLITDVYKHKPMDKIPFFICDTSYWIDGVAPEKYPVGYFDSPKIMTDYQLKKIDRHQKLYNDCYIPLLFPWFGTGVLPSAMGCGITYNDDGDPAVNSKILNSIDDIKELKIPDFYKDGLCPNVLNTIDYMIANTNLPVSFTDPQGPLNIAICLAGLENLFVWMYTNPDEVHQLMNFCTELFIEWVKLQKKHIGDRLNCFPHGIVLPEEFGNVWIADDDCVVINEELYKEFVVPYNSKIFKAFDGGTLHFCGSAHHQIDNFLNTEGCIGVNNFCMGDFKQLEMMQGAFKDKLVLMACDFTPSNVDEYYTTLIKTLDKKGVIIGSFYADNYALKDGKYEMLNRDNEKTLNRIYDILVKQ